MGITPDHLPAPVVGPCFITSPCVSSVQMVYGGPAGEPTVVVILNGLQLAPTVAEGCVDVPRIVC